MVVIVVTLHFSLLQARPFKNRSGGGL